MQPQPGVGPMRGRMMNSQQQQQQQHQQQQMMNNQGMMNNQMQPMNPNQVIEHDENLSDKEIYPGSIHQQVISAFLNCFVMIYDSSVVFWTYWRLQMNFIHLGIQFQFCWI